jgi:ligand-binding SRPBCC domain-containing protein
MATLIRRQYQIFVDRPPEAVFTFFTTPRNYGRITPEETAFLLKSEPTTDLGPGAHLTWKVQVGGLWRILESEIFEWNPPDGFAERQVRGPFAGWIHRRKFSPFQTGTLINETIEYTPGGGPLLAALADKLGYGAQLDDLFAHRHAEAKRLMETVTRIKGRGN